MPEQAQIHATILYQKKTFNHETLTNSKFCVIGIITKNS